MVVGAVFADDRATEAEHAAGAKPQPASFGEEGDVLRLTKRLVACLNASQKISLLQDLLVSVRGCGVFCSHRAKY